MDALGVGLVVVGCFVWAKISGWHYPVGIGLVVAGLVLLALGR